MSGARESPRPRRVPVSRRALMDATLYAGLLDELRAPDVYRCVEDHAVGWSGDEKKALALEIVRELLVGGLVAAGEPRRSRTWREEQDEWEDRWNYGPGDRMPSHAVWAAWDVSPDAAADRISAGWPDDPYDFDQIPTWELVLTALGRKALADKGITE